LAEGAKGLAGDANILEARTRTVGQPVGKAAEWNAMRKVSLGRCRRPRNIRCGHWLVLPPIQILLFTSGPTGVEVRNDNHYHLSCSWPHSQAGRPCPWDSAPACVDLDSLDYGHLTSPARQTRWWGFLSLIITAPSASYLRN